MADALIKVTAAAVGADVFLEGDLHVADVVGVEERLKDAVSEA